MAAIFIRFLWKLRNHLYFKIIPRQPSGPHGSQGGMWRFAPILWQNFPDCLECSMWVDHENRYVDHIVKTTSGGHQDSVQILKCLSHLLFQAVLRGTILQAA